MNGKELLNRCKRKDAHAQKELYERYKSQLMGLCRRYASNREDARDLLQEAFIKIYSRIHQVGDADKLEGWMKSVAVNTAIDHFHKTSKNKMPSYSDKEPDVAEPTEGIIERLSDEQLIAMIEELPEGCRLVFNLFEVEGYSHKEICNELNISIGTSRSQLFHAKYLLKEKLSRIGVKRYEKIA